MSTNLEDRLRAALTNRAEQTTIGDPHMTRLITSPARRTNGHPGWLATAAVLVVLVAGLVVFQRTRVDHTGHPATPTALDPMRIDLDGLRTGRAPTPRTDYVIVDTAAALPDGWTISGSVGFPSLAPNGAEISY